MTTLTHTSTSPSQPSSRHVSLLNLLALYSQRRSLASLSPAALDDLGLTRTQADAESRRPIWDVPSN